MAPVKNRLFKYAAVPQADDFGLGFLWAWIYCTWFTPGVFPETFFSSEAAYATLDNSSWLVSLVCCSVLLFAMPRILRAAPFSRPAAIAVSAAVVCSATALMHFSFASGTTWLYLLSAALTGAGSAGMWGLWGERYELKTQSLSILVPLSALVVGAFVLLCWAVPAELAFALCLALPLVSGVLYLVKLPAGKMPRMSSGAISGAQSSGPALDPGKSLSILVKLCVFVSIACALCSFARVGGDTHATAIPPALSIIAGMVFVFAVAWRTRRMNQAFDFMRPARWLILLEVASFSLLLTELPYSSEVASALALAVSTCFDFLLFMCLTHVIERGVFSSTIAFCISEGAIQVGWLVGDALTVSFATSGAYSVLWSRCLWAFSICLLFVATFLIFDQQGNLRKLIGNRSNREVVEQAGSAYQLSPREVEIAAFLVQGRSVPYISDELFLAKSTVETHVKHIYKKTGVHSRQELINLVTERQEG